MSTPLLAGNRLGLGAMLLALGGSVRDPGTAVAILRRAVELGVTHIDTAGTSTWSTCASAAWAPRVANHWATASPRWPGCGPRG